MKLSLILAAIILTATHSFAAHAEAAAPTPSEVVIGELDPTDIDIQDELKANEAIFGAGIDVQDDFRDMFTSSSCRRIACAVWADVDKSRQSITIYENGQRLGTWPVSSGVPGRDTPDFETHPDGRVYDAYSSTKFPGGDYNGLGNMPYVVFVSGGYGIHGTPQGNWWHLGQRASHGCVRVHPDVAFKFNRMVRHYGSRNVWVSIHD